MKIKFKLTLCIVNFQDGNNLDERWPSALGRKRKMYGAAIELSNSLVE